MPQETLQEEMERLAEESGMSASLEREHGGSVPVSNAPPQVTPEEVPTVQNSLGRLLTRDVQNDLVSFAEGAVTGGATGAALGGPVGGVGGALIGGGLQMRLNRALGADNPRARAGALLGELAIPGAGPIRRGGRSAGVLNELLRAGAVGGGAAALSGDPQAAATEAGASLLGSGVAGAVRAPLRRLSQRPGAARDLTSDVGERFQQPGLREASTMAPDEAIGAAREQGLDIGLSVLEETGQGRAVRRAAGLFGAMSSGSQRRLTERAARRDTSLQAFVRQQFGENVTANATRGMRDALGEIQIAGENAIVRSGTGRQQIFTRLPKDEALALRQMGVGNPDLPIDSMLQRAVDGSLAPGKKGVDLANGLTKIFRKLDRTEAGSELVGQYRAEVMQALVRKSQSGIEAGAKTGITSGRKFADVIDGMDIEKLEAVFGETAPTVKLISRVYRNLDPAEFAREAIGEFAPLRFLMNKIIFGAASRGAVGAGGGAALGAMGSSVLGSGLGLAAAMTLPAFAEAIVFNERLSKEIVDAASNGNGRAIRNMMRSIVAGALVRGQPVRRTEDGQHLIGDGNTEAPQPQPPTLRDFLNF